MYRRTRGVNLSNDPAVSNNDLPGKEKVSYPIA